VEELGVEQALRRWTAEAQEQEQWELKAKEPLWSLFLNGTARHTPFP
jgi:hypothetical protein